jgi:SAM-dependent methyltransferase
MFTGGKLVIDLGCGDGTWLDMVGPRYGHAIGVDISRSAFERRSTLPSEWEFRQHDLDQGLPFDDGLADAIHANQVIEHIREPVKFLAEVHRVLRPGGMLVVTTPNVRSVRHLVRLAVLGRGPMTSTHEPNPARAWDDGHLHYFTPGDVRRIAHTAGFEAVRVSALVAPTGRLQQVRPFLARHAAAAPIREFISGNILLVARR